MCYASAVDVTWVFMIIVMMLAFWPLQIIAIVDAHRRGHTGWAIAVGLSMLVFPLSLVLAVVYLAVVRRRPELQGLSVPAAPGWLDDPTGRHQIRYWDGGTWTAAVSDDGTATHDPLD